MDSVSQRLRRACCSGEAAVLMLRLAVRPACLASSWYGPWESEEAIQQLFIANAWKSLLRALKALLVTFGDNLAKQYNVINIVSDILHVSRASSAPASCYASLHCGSADICLAVSCCAAQCSICDMHAQIFYSLSERNTTLRQGGPTDNNFGTFVSPCLLQALCLVVEHAADLPRLHQLQASSGDTALLMVGPCLISGCFCSRLHMTELFPAMVVMASAHAPLQ